MAVRTHHQARPQSPAPTVDVGHDAVDPAAGVPRELAHLGAEHQLDTGHRCRRGSHQGVQGLALNVVAVHIAAEFFPEPTAVVRPAPFVVAHRVQFVEPAIEAEALNRG